MTFMLVWRLVCSLFVGIVIVGAWRSGGIRLWLACLSLALWAVIIWWMPGLPETAL